MNRYALVKIQEMARIERMLTDEQIQNELDTYNQLIPDPNELSGTLFIEIDDLLILVLVALGAIAAGGGMTVMARQGTPLRVAAEAGGHPAGGVDLAP